MTGVKRFGRNLRGRDFLCGDVHGRFDLLNEAMERVSFDAARDRMFCVGDLVDRGPYSDMAHIWSRQDWFHSVRGNHEQKLIDWSHGLVDRGWHSEHGGAWWYGLNARKQQIIVNEFKRLPFAIELDCVHGTIGIVHAEVFGNWRAHCDTLALDLGPIAAADLFRRKRWREKDCTPVTGIDAVVVGHVIVKDVSLLGNTLYIDTGAFKTDRLTVIEAGEALRMVQAQPDFV